MVPKELLSTEITSTAKLSLNSRGVELERSSLEWLRHLSKVFDRNYKYLLHYMWFNGEKVGKKNR